MFGPRLSDADFFLKIDTNLPGLENIPEMIAQSNYVEARKIFAAHVRNTLQPDRFLKIEREFRGAYFMYEGETPEQAAERILRGELISCGTPHLFTGEVDWFINPTFNQYKEWTWQLSRHPEWGILAERYRATGDERYAEAFVRYFKSWVKQALVPINEPGGATLCWRTIEAGIRMGGVWQWALHSFYQSPHFTDDVLIDWYKSVWEHGWRLRNFHCTGNWLIMEMNGLAQISILYPQFKDKVEWKQYAFDMLVKELDAQVYPDGWQVELSTGYHQVDIHNYQWLIDVCKAYDEPIPEKFRESMERMHTVNVLMMMPDGRLPDLNDGGWHAIDNLMKDAVLDYPHRQDFRWARTHGKEGHPPAQTSVAFPYAGYIVLRSSWSTDALWAVLDAGHFGYGHQHEDKLNLLIHAYGHLLLTEGGNYAYDDSEMRRYVLSTRAHNTIRIDKQDQNRRAHYYRAAFDVSLPSDGAYHFSKTFDIGEGIYQEGYGPDVDRSVIHKRKVILVKESAEKPGGFFLVIDRLQTIDSRTHTYQVLWHLNTDQAELNGLKGTTLNDQLPNLTIIPSQFAGMQASIIKGQESPEWQGWKAIKNHQQGEYAPIPTLVYEFAAKGSVRLATLLYPTRAGETCPVVSVQSSKDPTAVEIQITYSNGDIVTIDENLIPG